jgi:hypothetical protein
MSRIVHPLTVNIVTSLAVVVLATWSSRVLACTPISCFEGEFIPHDGGVVPANAPALAWRPPSYRNSPLRPAVHLIRLDTHEQVEVAVLGDSDTALLELRPVSLIEGVRYRLETDADGCTTAPAEFEVVEATPLPTNLGMPAVADSALEDIRVWTNSGTCYAPLPVTRLSIELGQTAAGDAWADLLVYRAIVDDQPWTPSLEHRLTSSTALVFSRCPPQPGQQIDPGIQERGLALGEHTFRFEADLPGAMSVSSTELSCELACGPASNGSGSTELQHGNTICSATGISSSRPINARMVTLLLGAALLAWRRRKRCRHRGAVVRGADG